MIEFEKDSPALPGYANKAIKELWGYIRCAQIAPASRRSRTRQEAINALRILVSSLEELHSAEEFERLEKAGILERIYAPLLKLPERKAS